MMANGANSPKNVDGYTLFVQNQAEGGAYPEYILFEVWSAHKKYEFTKWSLIDPAVTALMPAILSAVNNPWPATGFSVTVNNAGDITGVAGTAQPPTDPELAKMIAALRAAWPNLSANTKESIGRALTPIRD
jgi:hypothetical protein